MLNFFHRKHALFLSLAALSTLLYLVEYFMFGNVRDITTSFLGNLAFLPVYVIFVTLMIEQIMQERERQTIMRKLNMVIGVFYSEVGNRLLKELSVCVIMGDDLHRELRVTAHWNESEFQRALTFLRDNDPHIDSTRCDKRLLKDFLTAKRSFLVGLLENQNLLEHDQFTDLLWAVFHLLEELEARESFDVVPVTDVEHLNGDIRRVFGYLTREWVFYMKHLKEDYPYLFSLAVRLNPMLDITDPLIYS